jgi:hypothetical protein
VDVVRVVAEIAPGRLDSKAIVAWSTNRFILLVYPKPKPLITTGEILRNVLARERLT